MNLCHCSYSSLLDKSHSNIAFTILAPLVNKNKLTETILYNHKALTTLHHYVPTSQFQAFNFLEFLSNSVLATSHIESAYLKPY